MTPLRPAVFLDRDGVINEAPVVDGKPTSPRHLNELHVASDAPRACEVLKACGFVLVVVTNQPDISRRLTDAVTVDAMNDHLLGCLPLDAAYVCPHDDRDGCSCRKPAAGLIMTAATSMDLDLGTSYMIGDRWRDIEAGRRAGCVTVHIDRNYAEPRPSSSDAVVESLFEAAEWIVADAARKRNCID